MSRRYRDHDDDRGEQDYGRSRNSEYGRNYGERSQGRYGSGSSLRDESERYSSESRWRGQYGGGQSRGGQFGSTSEYGGGQDRGWSGSGREDYGAGWSGSGREGEFGSGGWANTSRGSYGGYGSGGGSGSDRESQGGYGGSQNRGGWSGGGRESYGGGREDYNSNAWDRDRGYYEERGYGSSSPLGRDAQRRFREASSSYSRNYDYPNDSPSRDMYSNAGERTFDYDRSRYGRGQERGYGYESDRSGQERGWWDRASDTVASWFGDEEAERRRRMDEQREQNRGRGPKGYRRSDERIKEDVNDRLSEGYLDASDVEVEVQNSEVTLTGTVNSRQDKRRAEDIAESVSGVTHVENRIRVKQRGWEGYGAGMGTSTGTTGTETSGVTGTTGPTGTTGTTGTTGSTGTTGTSDTSTSSPTSTSSAAAGGTGGSGRSRT